MCLSSWLAKKTLIKLVLFFFIFLNLKWKADHFLACYNYILQHILLVHYLVAGLKHLALWLSPLSFILAVHIRMARHGPRVLITNGWVYSTKNSNLIFQSKSYKNSINTRVRYNVLVKKNHISTILTVNVGLCPWLWLWKYKIVLLSRDFFFFFNIIDEMKFL